MRQGPPAEADEAAQVRRVAQHEAMVGDVLRDDGARADGRVGTNGDAAEDCAVGAEACARLHDGLDQAGVIPQLGAREQVVGELDGGADEDVVAILEEEMAKGRFSAVLHCYTGGADLARRGLALGLYISFSGILTFKKSDALREIARDVPLDRILVETDAPYLAPGKYRGKRNEPAYVVETAGQLARVKGIAFEELARVTTDNFHRLYSKAPRAGSAA